MTRLLKVAVKGQFPGVLLQEVFEALKSGNFPARREWLPFAISPQEYGPLHRQDGYQVGLKLF
jgi:hypothetical protein